jgi:hypothetical protein
LVAQLLIETITLLLKKYNHPMSNEVATSSLAPHRIHHEQCPVCHSKDIRQVLEARDYTVSDEIFSVWECGQCKLRFTQDIPVEEEVGAYYQSEEYVSHSNTSKGFINNVYQRVRKRTLKTKRQLIEKNAGTPKGRILDIGCGTGEFLATMTDAGWEGLGLEPDDGARAQAKSLGLKVYDNEELFRLGPEGYDAVTMWHVLGARSSASRIHGCDKPCFEARRLTSYCGT